jgi:lipopolysaccharide export system permease protein
VRIFDGPLIIPAVLIAVAAVAAWRIVAMLGILDRQRYWAFFKAYVICYVSLVGLYIVIDAFSNLDEFTKRADNTTELFQIMSRFYLVHQSEFFDRLCGVIGMMAAIFTVTWMQRNNEQLAMLAAGISTHRAIIPVLVSSVIVSLFAVANQEVAMPYFGEELARRHDDDGFQQVNLVSTRYDARGIMMHGKSADRATRTIMRYYATMPRPVLGKIHEIIGSQATYIPPDHPTAPLKGGWLIREATINPPLDQEEFQDSEAILTRVDNLDRFPPPLVVSDKVDNKPNTPEAVPAPEEPAPSSLTPHSEVAYVASAAPLPFAVNLGLEKAHVLLDRRLDLVRGTYFLKSALTFQALTRKSNWYQFATTPELLQSLTDPSLEGTQELDVEIFLHGRVLRPVLSMALLFMSLPLVLGGYGRNMFINLGFALGNSAVFYGVLIFAQYLGSFAIITPALTAWAPLMGFGMIATLRWGQIRT